MLNAYIDKQLLGHQHYWVFNLKLSTEAENAI